MASYEAFNHDVESKRTYKQSKKRSEANNFNSNDGNIKPSKKKVKTAKLPIVLEQKPHVIDNSLKCCLCDFKAPNDLSIKQSVIIESHLIDDHCLLKCALCESETLKKSYIEHLNCVHIPECTEICYLCPYTVQISEECKQHLNLTEFLQHMCVSSKMSEYRDSYKCPICDKVLKTTETVADDFELLSQHFQHVHSISMYNCELCTASFRDGWCLVEHILCEHKPMNMDNNEFNDDGSNVYDKYLKCFKCSKIIKFSNIQAIKIHELDCCPGNKIENYANGGNLISNGNASARNNADSQTNSNLFINPLSILSNVSTSVPHILSSSSSAAGELGLPPNEYLSKTSIDDDCLLNSAAAIKLEEDAHYVDAHLSIRSPPHIIDETVIETIAEQVEI
jgi:hypothetical protein